MHAVVDSTNAESLRRPVPWRVMAAGEQTAGRGRRSRSWQSPPGTSVSVSLTVPWNPSVAQPGWLPLLAGLAMAEALAAVTGGGSFGVKWPNDVLADGGGDQADQTSPAVRAGKVCGVLCEVGSGCVVIGAGVNVRVPAVALPVPTATSLQLCGHPGVSRVDVVAAFAEAVAVRYLQWSTGGQAAEGVRQDYRARCRTLGAPVQIHLPGGQVAGGLAAEVDDDGRIVLDTGTARQAYSAGDVVHLRPVPR